LHGHLISDRFVELDDSGVMPQLGRMEESTNVCLMLDEFSHSLGENKGDRLDVHIEGDGMI
jgi:hypothetical protein